MLEKSQTHYIIFLQYSVVFIKYNMPLFVPANVKRERRRFLQVCGSITGSIVLAGCSGDDDEEEDETPEPTTTPTPEQEEETPTPEPTTTPTPEQEEETPTPEPEPAFGLVDVQAERVIMPDQTTYEATAFVENSGDADGTAEITVEFGPVRTTVEESIATGESLPLTAEFDAEVIDAGRYNLTLTLGEETRSVDVDVFAAIDEPACSDLSSRRVIPH
ncbi:hypothetical protein [Halovenus salina]|uniref:CARDB domain-containing protein n=1 Tax=Halovenus salina TaxID=1510225 RepID=A0ABD5W3W2_9EURY|nr:hypothetical protein [Halovenus salina]